MHRFTFSYEAVLKMKNTSIIILQKMKKNIFERSFFQDHVITQYGSKSTKGFPFEMNKENNQKHLNSSRRVEKRKTNQMNIFILAKKEILRNLTI